MSVPDLSPSIVSFALYPFVDDAHQGVTFGPFLELSAISSRQMPQLSSICPSVPSIALESVSQLLDVPTWMSRQKLKSEMYTQLPPNLSPQQGLSRCLQNSIEPQNAHFR